MVGIDFECPTYSCCYDRKATGFSWSEGPTLVSLPSGVSFLIFSDVKENRAYAWHRGKLDSFLDPSGCHEVRAA